MPGRIVAVGSFEHRRLPPGFALAQVSRHSPVNGSVALVPLLGWLDAAGHIGGRLGFLSPVYDSGTGLLIEWAPREQLIESGFRKCHPGAPYPSWTTCC